MGCRTWHATVTLGATQVSAADQVLLHNIPATTSRTNLKEEKQMRPLKSQTFGAADALTDLTYDEVVVNGSGDLLESRLVLIDPPSLLMSLGYLPQSIVWVAKRAIYGLRESPAL